MRAPHIYRSLDLSRRVASRHRSSYRRLQRIRWRNDWSWHMWALIVALIALCFLVPRLAELHDALHHPNVIHR